MGVGLPGAHRPGHQARRPRIQTTRAIARELDPIGPEPPLFPEDPGERAAVESAERWGDEVLQEVPRRLAWAILRRDRSTIDTFLADAHLGLPNAVAVATAAPVVMAVGSRINRARRGEQLAPTWSACPALLDRVDELIAEGVIGGPAVNAADLQIATSVRLLWCMQDIRPALEGRPAAPSTVPRAGLAGDATLPAVFPAEWLAPLRTRATAA